MTGQLIGRFENPLDIQFFLEEILTKVPNTAFKLGSCGTGFFVESDSKEILDLARKVWYNEAEWQTE